MAHLEHRVAMLAQIAAHRKLKAPGRHAPVVAAGLILLAGCAGGTKVAPEAIGWALQGHESVTLGPSFAAGTTRAVVYRDRWQEETYLLWRRDDGALMELIHAAVDPDQTVALEFALTVARSLKTWRRNGDAAATLGALGRARAPWGGAVFFRPYTLKGERAACFGFVSRWRLRYEDPRTRPTEALFGYYCAPPGRPLDAAALSRLFGDIRPQAWPPRAPITEAEGGLPALAFARGSKPAWATGNAGYPYRFARSYSIADGARQRE